MKKSAKNDSLLRYVYDEDYLMTTFGTLDTSIDQRTKKFFALWCEWSALRLIITREAGISVPAVKKILVGLGLKEFQDFQHKGKEFRFKDSSVLAFAKISLGDICV